MMMIMKTLSQPLVEGLNGHIPSRETAFSTSIVARSERWEYFLRRNSLSSSEIRFVQKRSKQCERQPGVAGAPGPVEAKVRNSAASSPVADYRRCTPQRQPDKEWGPEQPHLQKEPRTHFRSESVSGQ